MKSIHIHVYDSKTRDAEDLIEISDLRGRIVAIVSLSRARQKYGSAQFGWKTIGKVGDRPQFEKY